ncbi:hypothetical protein ACFTY8_40195 [Streptomyces mirabilis]|uniref:hypothetical protein n=1 Tax=Streptomyces mirabilis TaxID=68239 RepID=UPI00362B59BD
MSSAFEDAHYEEVFQEAPSARPATHLVYTLRPLSGPLSGYDAQSSHLYFFAEPDVAVELAGLSWRSPEQPWRTHTAAFTPPVAAAIAPEHWQAATAAYKARYDEAEFLLRRAAASPDAAHPYADRSAEISAAADRILSGLAARPPPAPPTGPAPPEQQQRQGHEQIPPKPPGPHLR